MLDLYKLEIFTLVAKTGSFTKTADLLLLSQSAVSQHIKSLEDGLGTRLFERSRSGTRLTEAGEHLLGYAEQILGLAETAVTTLTNVSNLKEGQLRLGATPVAGSYLLPGWIRTFWRQYPNLRVSLQTDTTPPTIAALQLRQLDIAFVEGEVAEYDQLTWLALQEIDLFLLVGKNHPWRDRGQVSIRDLDGQALVMRPPNSKTRQWLEDLFAQHRVSPNVVLEYDDPDAIKQTVIHGQCAAFLPSCMVSDDLLKGDLLALFIPEMQQKRVLKLVWDGKRPFTPISRAFIASLIETYPQLQNLL